MEYVNPFTPSFGEIPAHMAGRKAIVSDLMRAFESPSRRPELTTLLSGARGTGKTTLLALLAHKAETAGWISASTTSIPGMLDDLEISINRSAAHLIAPESGKQLTSVEVANIGALSFENAKPPKSNWRSRITDVLDQLAKTDTGLLITVDELDPSLDEMVELAAVYQHFVREGRKVALLMAGLPHNISVLVSSKTVSFLRRAQRYVLGRIPDYEVEEAFLSTVVDNGREADAEGLKYAVASIEGFPFLMQLVGYKSWDINPQKKTISAADFEAGVSLARAELEDKVLAATLRELSDEDIRFLSAMLQDDGDTKAGDLVKRLDRSSAQVAQYRRRLIDAGVIGERRRGVIGFDLPYFRDYLAEQVGFVG